MRLVGEKTTKSAIAKAIGVTRATLRKHFAEELTNQIDQAGQLDFDNQQAKAESPAAEPGRPPFEPNWRQREDVKLFKADGWSDDSIARQLRISRNTLTTYFKEELGDGAHAVRAEALRNLMASSRKGNVAASNALLKMSGLEPPPAPPKDSPPSSSAPAAPPPAAEPPKPALGKKEQQKADALDVPEEWAELMSDESASTTVN